MTLDKKAKASSCCGTGSDSGCECGEAGGKANEFRVLGLAPVPGETAGPASCCGAPPPEPGLPRFPGYSLEPFVADFLDTPAGPAPVVGTRLSARDYWGALLARLGPGRQDYQVSPGLYAVGNPDAESPVLVTANYKLTFDALRKELGGINVWVLVLDTFGVNVWCAAGKGTFATDELLRRIEATGLGQVVSHRELLLPQLGAPGVSGLKVKKESGFSVTWGPVRAADIRAFLEGGKEAAESMRAVTFSLKDRLVLIPVEVTNLVRPTLWAILALFVLSGIGSSVFAPGAAFHRGAYGLFAWFLAIFAGAVAVPALLPWLKPVTFSGKGALTGGLAGAALGIWAGFRIGGLSGLALFLLTSSVASYLAMNFTGATPFTSPTGVEREMRRAIPFQAAGLGLAVALWVAAGFTA